MRNNLEVFCVERIKWHTLHWCIVTNLTSHISVMKGMLNMKFSEDWCSMMYNYLPPIDSNFDVHQTGDFSFRGHSLNPLPLSISKIGIDKMSIRALSYLIKTRTRHNSWNSRNYDCNRSDVSDAFCSRDAYTVVYKTPQYYSPVCLIVYNIRNDLTLYVAENFCMSRATRSHFAYAWAAFLDVRLTC